MNILLWIGQCFLAATFLYSGICKSVFSEKELVAKGQTGVENLPILLIRFIGAMEIAGAFGITLPWLLNVLPVLTPISSLGFALIMVPAAIIHYKRGEYRNVLTNLVIFTVAVLIAFGRITY